VRVDRAVASPDLSRFSRNIGLRISVEHANDGGVESQSSKREMPPKMNIAGTRLLESRVVLRLASQGETIMRNKYVSAIAAILI